ncbi:MAG: hypothetical protein ABEL51_12815 [Salinibacter sp.]
MFIFYKLSDSIRSNIKSSPIKTKKIIPKLLLFVSLVGLLGCAASATVNRTQRQLRQVQDFQDVDVQSMSHYLDEYRKNGEDEVLYHLEKGMLHHLNQNWKKSSLHFEKADRAIRRNYTKSINRNAQSMIANDLQLAYSGEPYEDVYLNVIQCLNYLNGGRLNEALVEVRQFNRELEFINDKHKGLASSLSPDTAQVAIEKVNQKLDGVRLLGKEDGGAPIEIRQNSALARFLATVLYAKEGSTDDAEIELSNLRTAIGNQGQTDFLSTLSTRSGAMERVPPPDELTNPSAYNTLFVAFHGNAPRKEAKRYQFQFKVDNEEVQLDFAVPLLLLPGTEVERVRAIVVQDTLRLPVVEEMQKTAQAMFEKKKPILYTRAVVRSFLKAGLTEGSEEVVKEKSQENGKWLAERIGEHVSRYVAQADTRGWQTMPGVARAVVARLPTGTHDVTIQFLAYNGAVLQERTRQIHVEGTRDLSVGESFYLQ